MSSPNYSQDDFVDAMLERKEQAGGNDYLRQAVLTGTLGVMRRRRRIKRCMVATTLLGCYLAGMATVALWRTSAVSINPSTPQIALNTKTPTIVNQSKALSPEEELAEIKAYKSNPTPRSQFEVLRSAGDRYLQDPEKLQLAVRTYSRALKYASAKERAISPEHDSWLLMALKDAHSKEIKNNAQTL